MRKFVIHLFEFRFGFRHRLVWKLIALQLAFRSCVWLIWNLRLIFPFVNLFFGKTTRWLPTVQSIVAQFGFVGLEWLNIVFFISTGFRLDWFVQFIWNNQMVVLSKVNLILGLSILFWKLVIILDFGILAVPIMMLNLWVQRKTRFGLNSQGGIVLTRFRTQLGLVWCYLVVRLRRSGVVMQMRSLCSCPSCFCFKRRFQLRHF